MTSLETSCLGFVIKIKSSYNPELKHVTRGAISIAIQRLGVACILHPILTLCWKVQSVKQSMVARGVRSTQRVEGKGRFDRRTRRTRNGGV